MRLLILAGVLFLASCQDSNPPRKSTEGHPAPIVPLAKPVPVVIGKWEVIALNGRPPKAADPAINVRITALEISAQSQCVKWFWSYRLSGAAFSTQPARQSEAVCERSRSKTEQLFDQIMSSAARVRHLTDGGLYISNRTQTMVLRRSPQDR